MVELACTLTDKNKAWSLYMLLWENLRNLAHIH